MNKDWLKDVARLNMPVYQYESESIRILYAGYSQVKREYFSRMIMGNHHNKKYFGRRWFWQIPGLIKSHNCDLVLSEVSRMSSNNLKHRSGYILPEWIAMRINIDKPLDELCRASVSDFSDVKRRIRKYNLTYDITGKDDTLDMFIEKLHLPYIKNRYGDEALIVDLKAYWKSYSLPLLLTVKEDGALVSGVLCRIEGDTFYMFALGVIDGKDIYRVHGCIGALYYFSILEGQKRKLRYLNVGGSHPFLTDSLTKYKLGLGAEFVPAQVSYSQAVWLGVNRNSPAALDFIKRNPFLMVDSNGSVVMNDTK
jgi:hypothetical protein